jgi:hypothetical protein
VNNTLLPGSAANLKLAPLIGYNFRHKSYSLSPRNAVTQTKNRVNELLLQEGGLYSLQQLKTTCLGSGGMHTTYGCSNQFRSRNGRAYLCATINDALWSAFHKKHRPRPRPLTERAHHLPVSRKFQYSDLQPTPF